MLRAIRVSNFRSFKEPATLQLRPITLFLGRNSSGKSTLMRLFPLLRQSLEKQNASPVLWVSDVVDFGSVDDVINNHDRRSEIEITFEMDGASINSSLSRQSSIRQLAGRYSLGEIKYSIFLSSDNGKTTFSRLAICMDDQTVDIRFSEDGIFLKNITINEALMIGPDDRENIYADTSTMFPDFLRLADSDDDKSALGSFQFYPKVTDALSYFIHGRTKKATLDYMGRQLVYVPREHLGDFLRSLPNVVQSRTYEKGPLDRLSRALLVNDIPRIVTFADQVLTPVFQTVAYLGPVRAHGNRFYRIQELSVRSIDARGENLPMYLNSLSQRELGQFNDLLFETCGFNVKVGASGPGHVTVQIGRPTDDRYENVADVGFGFTQLLPVVAQLHAAIEDASRSIFTARQKSEGVSIIAIEQPELHLHPALQANLADLFAATVERGPKGLRLVLETHSETLIGRLGALVASGTIKSEDVGVYFVEKDDDIGESRLRFAEIDPAGYVKNWPVGFFSPDL